MTDLHWSGLQCQHVWDQGGKNRLIVNLLITFVVLCIEIVDMCILHIFLRPTSFNFESAIIENFEGAESFCCPFPQCFKKHLFSVAFEAAIGKLRHGGFSLCREFLLPFSSFV